MPTNCTRRSLIRTTAGTIAAGILSNTGAFGQQQQNSSQLRGPENGELRRLVAGFKRQFRVPGFSVAISRNGQFVYDRGFGMADRKDSIRSHGISTILGTRPN